MCSSGFGTVCVILLSDGIVCRVSHCIAIVFQISSAGSDKHSLAVYICTDKKCM